MIPTKDLYADKDGNLTDDPAKYAIQVAVAGVELDDRAAKRYGIEDSLISVDEPQAVRKVMGKSSEPKESEPESDDRQPASPVPCMHETARAGRSEEHTSELHSH